MSWPENNIRKQRAWVWVLLGLRVIFTRLGFFLWEGCACQEPAFLGRPPPGMLGSWFKWSPQTIDFAQSDTKDLSTHCSPVTPLYEGETEAPCLSHMPKATHQLRTAVTQGRAPKHKKKPCYQQPDVPKAGATGTLPQVPLHLLWLHFLRLRHQPSSPIRSVVTVPPSFTGSLSPGGTRTWPGRGGVAKGN